MSGLSNNKSKKITHKAISFNLIIENPTLFDKVKLSSFTNLRHIPHPQALPLRIVQSVGGAASGAGTPGNAAGGAVHQMSVSGQKGLTAGRLAADDYLVYPCLHRRYTGLLSGRPTALVVREGLHQDDAYLGSALPKHQQLFRHQRIKTQRAAHAKVTHALLQ